MRVRVTISISLDWLSTHQPKISHPQRPLHCWIDVDCEMPIEIHKDYMMSCKSESAHRKESKCAYSNDGHFFVTVLIVLCSPRDFSDCLHVEIQWLVELGHVTITVGMIFEIDLHSWEYYDVPIMSRGNPNNQVIFVCHWIFTSLVICSYSVQILGNTFVRLKIPVCGK